MALNRPRGTYSKLGRKEALDREEAPQEEASAPIENGEDEDLETGFSAELLTEEEKRAIEDELKAEVLAEAKEAEKARYRAEAKRQIRVKRGLEEPQITLIVDVPGFADRITLDGRPFYHGHTYTVADSVAASLLAQMNDSWNHEDNVGGANKNEYRRPRETGLSGKTGATNVASIQNSMTNSAPLSPLSAGRAIPKVTTSTNIHARQV